MTSIVVSLIRIQNVEHDKTLLFTHKVFKHISKTLISLISILQAVKNAIKNTGKKPGPNMEIYGPRSEYGFLRTADRPIRMQDSSKPYNNVFYAILFPVCEILPCLRRPQMVSSFFAVNLEIQLSVVPSHA